MIELLYLNQSNQNNKSSERSEHLLSGSETDYFSQNMMTKPEQLPSSMAIPTTEILAEAIALVRLQEQQETMEKTYDTYSRTC